MSLVNSLLDAPGVHAGDALGGFLLQTYSCCKLRSFWRVGCSSWRLYTRNQRRTRFAAFPSSAPDSSLSERNLCRPRGHEPYNEVCLLAQGRDVYSSWKMLKMARSLQKKWKRSYVFCFRSFIFHLFNIQFVQSCSYWQHYILSEVPRTEEGSISGE